MEIHYSTNEEDWTRRNISKIFDEQGHGSQNNNNNNINNPTHENARLEENKHIRWMKFKILCVWDILNLTSRLMCVNKF